MFNSSGSMYEEIEQNRLKKQRKKKLLIRRIIAIVLLLILLSYLGILLNDIRRFHKGDLPLITISSNTKEYDDGRVETYYSLGWIFRYYYRETINTQEIAPFWSSIKADSELKRESYDPNLPEIEKNYKVPSNTNKRDKVNGVLFFYDDNEQLLGTYKCILSEKDCEVTKSAYVDEYDKDVRKSDVQMAYIDNRYVFITEYKSKSTSVEEKTVFLYDMFAKHLIAQYQDVRYATTMEKEDDSQTYGLIDTTRFIAKKDNYWGVEEVSKSKTNNLVNFEYNIVNFEEETKLYILLNKQNKWVVYNPNTQVYTSPIDKTIESVHYKNGKAYIVAYEEVRFNEKNYYLFDEDGINVLYKENVDNLVAYDDFLIYAKGDTIYIINYDGQEATESIKLYINLDEAYNRRVKPYSVEIIDKTLVISTPKDQERTHFTDIYYYNLETLELIKTRQNVKETSY